jgi:hypothetical protein
MKTKFVFSQSKAFFADNFLKIRILLRGESDRFLVEHNDSTFGKCADCEFALKRVPDFAHNQNIEWEREDMRRGGGNDDSSTRQASDYVGINGQLTQMSAQLFSRIQA